MHINHAINDSLSARINGVQQFVSGEDPAWSRHQRLEQFELKRCEVYMACDVSGRDDVMILNKWSRGSVFVKQLLDQDTGFLWLASLKQGEGQQTLAAWSRMELTSCTSKGDGFWGALAFAQCRTGGLAQLPGFCCNLHELGQVCTASPALGETAPGCPAGGTPRLK
jgi:hypothetical protein